MKCYYHVTADAVALCKACNRALCLDCSANVPPGTACKGRCEEEVASINVMVERSKSAYQKAGQAYKVNALFLILGGLTFAVLGLIPVLRGRGMGTLFLVFIGTILIVWGLFSYRSGKQIQEVK